MWLGGGDFLAYPCQRSRAIENEITILDSYAELLPQVIKIDVLRLFSHVLVQRCQHRGPGGLVTCGEGLFDRPIMVNGSTGCDNAAQSVLQSFAISGLLANFYVCH